MRSRKLRGLRAAGLAVALTLPVLAATPMQPANATPVSGAVNTTDDPGWNGPNNDGLDLNGNQILGAPTQACLNGPPGHTSPAVNCNIYQSKTDVFSSGSPNPAALGAGTYFFAVLVPGGQPDPNDGSAKNLSSPDDAATNREFSSDGSGGITPLGSSSHAFDAVNQVEQVAPYEDTTNPGGVYILATCQISNETNHFQDPVPSVAASDCKYDAFKVQPPGTVPSACAPIITKDAAGTFDNRVKWTITKSVDNSPIDSASTTGTFDYTVTATHDDGTTGKANVTVTGTIKVFNCNANSDGSVAPMGITSVTDTLSNHTNCTVTGGGAQTLTAAETDFPYSCSLTGVPEGELDNTATVTWPTQDIQFDGGSITSSLPGDSASFTFFNIAFTATGTVVDNCTTVTDSFNGGSADTFGVACADGNFTKDAGNTLDGFSESYAAPTFTFTYPRDLTGTPGTCVTADNTATFTAADTDATGSDGATAKLCVGADLTVKKDAAPTFSRKYGWSITKSADKTKVTQAVGTTVTIKYTVTASQTGSTDSGWEATGNITVSNPNDWESVTLTGVTDSITGANCTVSGDKNQTIAASSDSTGLTYDCTFSSKPAYSTDITNTATATWDASAAFTPHGSAQGTKTFQFTTPTSTVNKTITVTDTHAGTLGTATATDSTPFASKTFTYNRTFNVTLGCNKFDNTATITETGQFASASVTICGQSGALTMGFWQNKNGQGIIHSYCTGNGGTSGTSLGVFLQGYDPFKDAPTTCGKVGSTSNTDLVGFVYNIIKVATCSGPTSSPCNKMLRAQDLATTLDVYFSDPLLGGNKIGAFNGLGGTQPVIGGLKVDLTQVCNMLDATNGTATCTGVYQDASNVFGVASPGCQTVSYLLGYANADGSAFSNGNPVATPNTGATWYNNNKPKQVLAKNAFDAINNGAAVGC